MRRLIMTTVLGLTHLRPPCVSHSVSDRAKKTQRPTFCHCCTVLQGEFRVGGPSEVDVAVFNERLLCENPGGQARGCGACLGSTYTFPIEVLERNVVVSCLQQVL